MIAVLLPGLDGTGDLFKLFVASRPAGIECVVVRYPPHQPLDYEQLVSLAAAAIPDDDVILVAESFSGPIALRIATDPRVRGVALCNSAITPPWPSWFSFAAKPALLRRPPARLLVRWFMVGRWAPHQLITAVRHAVAQVNPEVLALRLREVLNLDGRQSVPLINKPVLYLRGSVDRLVPDRCLAELQNLIPHMQVRRIEGPHLLLQLAPLECWSAIAGTLLS